MKVKECMCNNVVSLSPENTAFDAAKLMNEKHVGCIPVVDNNQNVVGLITDRDLTLRCMACNKDANLTPISEIMTTKIHSIASDANITEASNIMCNCQVKRVPVIDNNTLVGIITLGDLVNNQNITSQEVSRTVEGICRCGKNMQNNY